MLGLYIREAQGRVSHTRAPVVHPAALVVNTLYSTPVK